MLVSPGLAQAGKLSWLDDVVQDVIVEAKAGGKRLVRGGDGARTELRTGRLFLAGGADEGLEHLVRRSEELAQGRPAVRPTLGGPAQSPFLAVAQTRSAGSANV